VLHPVADMDLRRLPGRPSRNCYAGGADIASGKARLWLDSDRAGPGAVAISLTAACDTSGAQWIPSDQPGTSGSNVRPA
jgi:hypothetical protein